MLRSISISIAEVLSPELRGIALALSLDFLAQLKALNKRRA